VWHDTFGLAEAGHVDEEEHRRLSPLKLFTGVDRERRIEQL
jgi:hypothetical protein